MSVNSDTTTDGDLRSSSGVLFSGALCPEGGQVPDDSLLRLVHGDNMGGKPSAFMSIFRQIKPSLYTMSDLLRFLLDYWIFFSYIFVICVCKIDKFEIRNVQH